MGINVLSLFDGMSVAQQALFNIGINIDNYYASEIDPYAVSVTQSNFPDTIQIGSVVDVNCKDFKDIFLLVGGSPCQDLSIAKKDREGLSGSRSGLFWEYVRILNEIKPEYFILENVNSMPKEAKQIISEALGVNPIMINASLVSAQNRKRLFWVGKWNGEKYEQVEISQPEDRGILLKDILEIGVDEKYYISQQSVEKAVANRAPKTFPTGKKRGSMILDRLESGKALTLTTSCGSGENRTNNLISVINKDGTEKLKSNTFRTSGHGSGIDDKHNWDTIRVGSLNNGGQGDRVYSEEGKSVSLSANGGGRGAKTELYTVSGAASRTYPRIKVEGEERSKQIEIRDDGKANTMTSVQGDSMVSLETRIRKLTPIECLRLQSMPDNYFDKATYKNKPISNTQRYKMCGNAFNCDVIAHILKGLK